MNSPWGRIEPTQETTLTFGKVGFTVSVDGSRVTYDVEGNTSIPGVRVVYGVSDISINPATPNLPILLLPKDPIAIALPKIVHTTDLAK